MAVKVKATLICDRCQKPFDEKDPDQIPDHKPEPKFALRINGKEIIEFRDLCPRCDAAVSHFLADICLGEKYEKILKEVWGQTTSEGKEEKDQPAETSEAPEGTSEEAHEENAGQEGPGEGQYPF